MLCKICNGAVPKDNFLSLGWHIKTVHSCSSEKYYNTYIANEPYVPCILCGGKPAFTSMKEGYKILCSNCSVNRRSDYQKLVRKQLREDPIKFKKFSEKISNAVKDEWANKDQTKRILAPQQTLLENNKKLTKEERSKKFGWLNSVPEEDHLYYNKIISTGCHKWRSSASLSEKQAIYDKTKNTKSQWTEEYKKNLGNKISQALLKTWEIRGSEIMNKQMDTFLRNRNMTDDNDYTLEESIVVSLTKTFDL